MTSATPRHRRRAESPRTAVRLADVAARAGVSLATASRVLGDSSKPVGEQLAAAVHRACAELGYTVNLPARAVATGRSNAVGVLVHDIADPYFSTIAAGVMRVADAAGLLVSLANTSGDPLRELAYVAAMRAQRARALIILGSRSEDRAALQALGAELRRFERDGGRAACVGQDRLGVDTVSPQNLEGARALAQGLVGQGHERFVILAGPPELLAARDRVTGFTEGLASRGVEVGHLVHGAFTRDGGYTATKSALAADPGRKCLFAVNDVMAVGALACLRAGSLHVPARVALAGFDDIPTLQDVTPALSTVRLPLREMGALVASTALLDPAPDGPRVLSVAGEVMLRESTAPVALASAAPAA